MKVSELQDKSKSELNATLTDLLKEQFNLRMQKGMGETPKSHQFKRVRKDIARVKTMLNQQERQS